MHIRAQIRGAIKGRLEGQGLSVHANRVADLQNTDLPAALITVENDTSELLDKDGNQARVIDVFIDVVTDEINESLDDALDAFAVKIEGRMNTLFDGLAKEVQLVATDFDFRRDEDGDRWFAYMSLNYQVLTHTAEGDPTTVV